MTETRFIMKKWNTIILVIILLAPGCRKSYADYTTGSGFDRTQISEKSLANLEVLGRVWGYVKYHHPIFCSDKFDVDYELFELLPQIADTDIADRNRILTEWIDKLGTFSTDPEKYEAILSYEQRANQYCTDISWIRDTAILGATLSDRLTRLRIASREKENYYAYQEPENSILAPCFDREDPYKDIIKPDYGYRLLAVFRFWNMVEYYFPTKNLTDRAWNDILPLYIKRMTAPVDNDYYLEAWRLIAEINDDHAQMGYTYPFGHFRIPLHLAFIDKQLYVISPDTIDRSLSRAPGFCAGDRITAVDGLPVDHYISRTREFVPCSNENDILLATADNILRASTQKKFNISYLRNGEQKDTVMSEMEPMLNNFSKAHHSRYREAYKMIEDSIAYIYPARYATAHLNALTNILHKAKGLIIDLRCYPSQDFLDFIRMFIIPGKTTENNCKYTLPITDLPGVFFWVECSMSGYGGNKYNGMTVVLVDSQTQSYAEASVQWMQNNPRVRVVGSRSAGANGSVSYFTLPGGIKSRFSGLGWFYSDGTPVQRLGVKIDYQVQPTITGIRNGSDEPVEFAIKLINEEEPENLEE